MEQALYEQSPLLPSFLLEQQSKKVYFKMECYQPSGSFKFRGMEVLCKHYIAQGKDQFLTSSGGNAGYSLAYVGKKLGVEVKVIVPETTSAYMIEKIKRVGAEVEVFGKVWDEAHAHALQQVNDQIFYVPPFDHHLLWQGYTTIIDECAEKMEKPKSLVVSVGGGGLLSGILLGLKKNGWEDVEVYAAETIGAASLCDSIQAKKLMTREKIESIAYSLGAKTVAQQALDLSLELGVKSFVVSDKEAVKAMGMFLDEYKVLTEPACGAALAFPYLYPQKLSENGSTLVIVCGGVNVDLTAYLSLKEQFAC